MPADGIAVQVADAERSPRLAATIHVRRVQQLVVEQHRIARREFQVPKPLRGYPLLDLFLSTGSAQVRRCFFPTSFVGTSDSKGCEPKPWQGKGLYPWGRGGNLLH